MSLPRQIALAVIATPGIAQRELSKALGVEPSRVATAVTWLLAKGKLRDDSPVDPRTRTLYPTETTLSDGRSQRASKPRKPRRPPPSGTSKARKPSPASHIRVAAPPKPVAVKNSTGLETVAEFLARGGQIQRLPFGQCNNDLRFDHSGTTTFEQRRPVVRAYPAAGVL